MVSGWPPKYVSEMRTARPAPGNGPGSVTSTSDKQQHPWKHREDARLGPAEQDDEERPEGEYQARKQSAAEAHAQPARERECSERGEEQLERGDQGQRTPERQQVSRQAEGREDRRLRVGEIGAATGEVRVPQRYPGQRVARVLEERLKHLGGVDELVVRADADDPGRARRLPRRVVVEKVRRRQGPSGKEALADHGYRQHRVEQSGGEHRPRPQRCQETRWTTAGGRPAPSWRFRTAAHAKRHDRGVQRRSRWGGVSSTSSPAALGVRSPTGGASSASSKP